MRQGEPNQNFGSSSELRIRAAGRNRALLAFDGASLSGSLGGPLVRAVLKLPIAEAADNWGSARALGAHRMLRSWSELGATWNCAVDANTGNFTADCGSSNNWTMFGSGTDVPWRDPPTGTTLVSSGATGTLELDVTGDVACALAGFVPFNGWLIKKELENQSGRIDLHSRESATPPSLLLEWTNGAGVVVTAASCTGQPTPPGGCTPTAPLDSTCNGVDDDCDGQVDDDFAVAPTSCGVGACASTGALSCVAGQQVDSCVSGSPSASDAVCNLVDDDCDGLTDEDYVGVPTICGVGACRAPGLTECVLGQELEDCQPGNPAAADATCDSSDDDCDGTADEDFVPASTSCGIGACAAVGQTSCVVGQVVDGCVPRAAAANDATCNGVDDDCNGSADEDYVPVATSCGVGRCGSTGSTHCAGGLVSDDCTPGTPASNDSSCDGVDDDCDGAADEDFVRSCLGNALTSCVSGALQQNDCSDGNVCNGSESCVNAACVPGTPPTLDDQNPCTTDSCVPASGVRHEPAVGQACSFDACHAGVCDASGTCHQSTEPVDDDGDPCTIAFCDPATGQTQVTCQAVDESRVTTIFDSTSWIYSGAAPMQTGVAPGTIERRRVALLHGEVSDRSGAPLSGVEITVADHPELGRTQSQVDGKFDLVVNAGGQLTIAFRAPGRLSAQRSLEVAWNEIARVPPVVLIESDPVVTEIDLAQTTAPFQVATGSLQVDGDGERQATLLFPAGTAAMMLRADGTSVPISTMHVRATEFTVGETGPDAMPGPLPPTTAYTYAVEFNADEAVNSGAVSIEFNVPLIGYVDNFLDFPAGTLVPVGAYDGRVHRWLPHKSGVVVDIVSISAAGADLDVTGDGVADSAAVLQARGIGPEERVQLAALKAPGDSVWRFEVPHFSEPYDCNWPFGPPPGAGPPPAPDDDGPGDPGDSPDDGDQPAGDDSSGPESDDPCKRSGSLIECQTMTLRESLPVAGTPYKLEYASNRVFGRQDTRQLPIRISGAVIPGPLQRIELEVDIAGQHHFQQFAPAPNQFYVFDWDGKDSYGRYLKGQQTAHVRLRYAYQGSYQTTGSFGGQPNGVISGSRARQEIYLNQQWSAQLGAWEPPGLGGWTLDVHHAYDATSGAIYFGDGRRRLAAQWSSVLSRAASPAQGSSTLGHLHAVGPDGSLYLIIDIGWAFRRSPDGTLTQLTPSNLQFSDLALAPDGSLYLIQVGQHRVYRRDAGGTLSVIAGTGVAGFSGDNGPAATAQLNDPRGIAVDGAGAIYIADTLNRRIRRIGPDGVIRTVAGNGSGAAAQEVDGVAATQSAVLLPSNVAVAQDGTIYIGDNFNHRLYEVAPTGIINRIIASADPILSGLVYQDGMPGRQARVYGPNTIAVTPQGQVFFLGSFYWQTTTREEAVFTISPDKRIYRVIGGARLDGVIQAYYPGAPPRGISLLGSNFTNPDVEVVSGPDGLYVGLGSAVDRLTVPPPKLSSLLSSDLLVPAEEDGEVYVFDTSGRHKSTRHVGTGAVLREFFYDANGLLSELRDAEGNRTLIERDANGAPVAIQAPYGQRTLLQLDANGYLSRIEDPLGAETLLSSSADGLLESITDGRGAITTMEYDTLGRLKRQHQANGGQQQLLAFGNTSRWKLDFVSAEARSTSYRVDQNSKGEVYTSTFPDGTSSNTSYDTNAARWVTTAHDGTVTTTRETSDLRFGLARPLRETVLRLPSGLTYTVQTTRTLNGVSATNPFDYSNEITNIAVNGNTWREDYSPLSRQRTLTSPESRQVSIREDLTGRVTQQTTTGQQPVLYAYDSRGRLETITQGSRVTRLTYDESSSGSSGYLQSVINALGQTTLFHRDARGRAIQEQYPDGASSQFAWDENDNLLSLQPPDRPAHTQTYSPMDELETSAPPLVAGVSDSSSSYEYNLDRQITSETRPDRSVVGMTYDSAGRRSTISLPTGAVTYAYYPNTTCSGCAPGQLMRLSGPSNVAVTTEYNGRLVAANTWSGDVNGSLRWTHDSNFRISTETASAGASNVSLTFGYDRDGLQTCASPSTCTTPGTDALRYTYNSAGQPLTTRLGNVNLNYAYNQFGELASATATFNSTPLFAAVYDSSSQPRDALGRIVTKSETIGGVTTNWGYAYDLRGRLDSVSKNGVSSSSYTYDDNGNRLSETTAAGTITSDHDEQDRLLSRGLLTFSYRESGELESALDAGSGALTSYNYDALGNLLAVVLPDGREISYVADGRGRRVGKAVDGVPVQGLIYRDQLRVAAELNGAGQVLSQFVYTNIDHSPDAMRRGGQMFRFIKDQLGSVRMVVNATTGEVVQALDYDAFGVVLQDTNPGFQPFGFAGGLYDPDTGLVRFGGRDYSALAGRWTAKDPAGIAVSANLYAYVGNNPVSETDPTGECPWCVAAGVGALSGAGFDLALQLLMNGGRLQCVDWGSVGTAALLGAALSGLGPSGFLLGRGGPKAAQYGYSETRSVLNRGASRFGWSGPKNGKDVLSLRLGSKHFDVPGLGLPSGANPTRDGLGSGLLGGGLNRGASGSCDCD